MVKFPDIWSNFLGYSSLIHSKTDWSIAHIWHFCPFWLPNSLREGWEHWEPIIGFIMTYMSSHYFPGACLIALTALKSMFCYMVFSLIWSILAGQNVDHITGSQCINTKFTTLAMEFADSNYEFRMDLHFSLSHPRGALGRFRTLRPLSWSALGPLRAPPDGPPGLLSPSVWTM